MSSMGDGRNDGDAPYLRVFCQKRGRITRDVFLGQVGHEIRHLSAILICIFVFATG